MGLPNPNAELVTALGGPTQIARWLTKKIPTRKWRPQAISNWKLRGVPSYLRPTIAEMAKGLNVAVPDGFLGVDGADAQA